MGLNEWGVLGTVEQVRKSSYWSRWGGISSVPSTPTAMNGLLHSREAGAAAIIASCSSILGLPSSIVFLLLKTFNDSIIA